jgi:hypothetical protein
MSKQTILIIDESINPPFEKIFDPPLKIERPRSCILCKGELQNGVCYGCTSYNRNPDRDAIEIGYRATYGGKLSRTFDRYSVKITHANGVVEYQK